MAVSLESYQEAAATIPATEDHRHGMVVCQCGAVLSRCACAIWPIRQIQPACDRCHGAPPSPETAPTPDPTPDPVPDADPAPEGV